MPKLWQLLSFRFKQVPIQNCEAANYNLTDFEDIEENSTFLVDLIENHLLKIFWASNDPHKQLFAAYVMQSFLAVMGLDERVLNIKDNRVWNKFTDVAKSTLTPFLKSKYAAPKPKLDNLKFPFSN